MKQKIIFFSSFFRMIEEVKLLTVNSIFTSNQETIASVDEQLITNQWTEYDFKSEDWWENVYHNKNNTTLNSHEVIKKKSNKSIIRYELPSFLCFIDHIRDLRCKFSLNHLHSNFHSLNNPKSLLDTFIYIQELSSSLYIILGYFLFRK